ncbi:unnamed protein product [Closterium sp. NIES-65]|nr:unnamed protein product [Closterium sp. NIES-65]
MGSLPPPYLRHSAAAPPLPSSAIPPRFHIRTLSLSRVLSAPSSRLSQESAPRLTSEGAAAGAVLSSPSSPPHFPTLPSPSPTSLALARQWVWDDWGGCNPALTSWPFRPPPFAPLLSPPSFRPPPFAPLLSPPSFRPLPFAPLLSPPSFRPPPFAPLLLPSSPPSLPLPPSQPISPKWLPMYWWLASLPPSTRNLAPWEPISPKWLPMYRWLASLPPTTPTLAAWEVRQWVQQEWGRLPLELRRTPMQRIVQYTVTAFHRIKHQGGLGVVGEGMVQGEGSVGGEEGEEDVVGDGDGMGREAGRGRDGGRRDRGSGGDRGMGRRAERRRGAGVGAEGVDYDECRSSGERGDGEEGDEEGDEDGEGEEVGEERRGGEGDAGRRRRRGGRMATYTEHPMKKQRAVEAAVGGEAAEAKEVGRLVQQQHCALVNHFNSRPKDKAFTAVVWRHMRGRGGGGRGSSRGAVQEVGRLVQQQHCALVNHFSSLVLLQHHLLLLQECSVERTDSKRLGQGYRGREEGKGKREEEGRGEEQQEGKGSEEQQSVGQGGQEGKGQEDQNGEGKRGGEGGDCEKQTSAVRRHEFVPPWKPPFAPRHCSQRDEGREAGRHRVGRRQGERQGPESRMERSGEIHESSQERVVGTSYPQQEGAEGRGAGRRQGEGGVERCGVGRRQGEGEGPEAPLKAWVVCSVDYHRCDFKGGRSSDGGSREVCGGGGRGRRGGGEMAGGNLGGQEGTMEGCEKEAALGEDENEEEVKQGRREGIRNGGTEHAGERMGSSAVGGMGRGVGDGGVSAAVRARECGRGYRRLAGWGESGGAESRGRWMRAKSAQGYSSVWTGWGSLDNPRRGLGSVLCQSRGDTWRPTWASYTSHAADAPTTNISDVR